MTLVGRDIELEAISRAIDQARAGGFHTVVISGEPGIGKTTLLAESARSRRPRRSRCCARGP